MLKMFARKLALITSINGFSVLTGNGANRTMMDSDSIIEKAFRKVDSYNTSYADTKFSKERWIKFGTDCIEAFKQELEQRIEKLKLQPQVFGAKFYNKALDDAKHEILGDAKA